MKSETAKMNWKIGKLSEKKTRELLREQGHVIIASDVDSAGVDIISFKNKTIYLVEVKGSRYVDKSWKELISKKQFKKYKKLEFELLNEGFNVNFYLYYWFKENNRWEYKLFDLTKTIW